MYNVYLAIIRSTLTYGCKALILIIILIKWLGHAMKKKLKWDISYTREEDLEEKMGWWDRREFRKLTTEEM